MQMESQDKFVYQVGRAIRAVRKQKQLTQVQVGIIAGLSNHYLSMIEQGYHAVSIRMLSAIATALEVTPAELLKQAEKL